MPTNYPKSTPTEMMGFLALLNEHKGSEDLARLAMDLDLEIDEILPSVDFAGTLQLVKLSDGRATLTDVGRRLIAGSIRDRKSILRDQLRRTALFKTLVRALESSSTRKLSEAEMLRLIEFTTAPADELVQNIINWGRYVELFRYDPEEHVLWLPRGWQARRPSAKPPSPPAATATARPASSSAPSSDREPTTSVAGA
ncbi:MAG TPA: AAA-associated domain-containing protein [Thermoplasmata archaeon]|nr:AAA-associated domain-containing protein [Thermoplasmata archaeon]